MASKKVESLPIEDLSTQYREAVASNTTDANEMNRFLRAYSEKEYSIHNLTRSGRKYRPRKEEKLGFNVIRSCIDGLVALLCENRTMITYTTSGANWPLRKKARKRSKAVLGAFQVNKLSGKVPLVAKHAGIFGRGHVMVLREFGEAVLETVPPWEVTVNQNQCLSGEPTEMWRHRWVDARKLAKLFPAKKAEILKAAKDGEKRPLKPLELVDYWQLPSGPKTGDGYRAQFIPDVTLLADGEWKHKRFPICTFLLDDDAVEWGGTGLCEQLEGIQNEINSVLETISNNAYNGGNIKAFVQAGGKVSMATQLSNALGCPVVEYNGDAAPTVAVGELGLGQLLGYLQHLEDRAYQLTGISQSSAQSRALPASQSGRAALIQNQNYSKRFIAQHQRLEQFHGDIAEAIVDAWEDLVEDGKNTTIMFSGQTSIEPIELKDVVGDRDEMTIRPWATSLMGESPQAKVAMIDQYMSIGMLDLAGAMMLADIPYDLASHVETILAPRELADQMVNLMVEDGVPQIPVPIMDLEYAAMAAALWWQRGYTAGVETKKLNMLLDFHNMCRALQPPPMPPVDGTGVPSGGVPVDNATPNLSPAAVA